MSAGIETLDKGFVYGSTWHNDPRYKTLDRPVTNEEARSVLDYPMSRRQLGYWLDGNVKLVNAYAIQRDEGDCPVLVPHVGKRFVVLSNTHLFDSVKANLLDAYPELVIESVGTLNNGAIAFVNIMLREFTVRGDDSKTVSRLMYYNPLGLGSYKVCAHDVRIVCKNTLAIAELQGAANKSLSRIPHTASAGQKISAQLIDLAEIRLGLELHEARLQHLAEQKVTAQQVEQYINTLFPERKEQTDRSKNILLDFRARIQGQFERQKLDMPGAWDSKYGILNAITNVVDYQKSRQRKDAQDIGNYFDGIIGDTADVKSNALEVLSV